MSEKIITVGQAFEKGLSQTDKKKKIIAVGLYSGGLDSILAAKVLLDQGIDVRLLHVTSPFFGEKDHVSGKVSIAGHDVPICVESVGSDYIRMIRKPRHGHGAGINPCIDCKIYMLKMARRYASSIGAKFVFTGEVVGQRPMSQRGQIMKLVLRESGLEGRLVRPLSGKLLAKTEAEVMGWIDREKLLDIQGRSRRRQIEMAREFGVTDYPEPAGGCMLTNKEFADKMKDLFSHNKRVDIRDIEMLKVGRHFRVLGTKVVVGANKADNERLLELKRDSDYILEVKGCGSPITLVDSDAGIDALTIAARLTARYADARGPIVSVSFGKKKAWKTMDVLPMEQDEIEKIRI